eukprot:TRINITY_DN9211_c0_g1_i2.p4 TRINITY_DN9211_c0_g1~~TRINITY_DN9211_c0_g1_i2.p4  ORF type:complete len:119 (+),score=47.03 TRINITY_DN9211_c0_g1_i2:992-1348(+)
MCSAANAAALLEVVDCKHTQRPLELLLREAEAVAPEPYEKLPWIGTRLRSSFTTGAAAFAKASGLFDAGADWTKLPRKASKDDQSRPLSLELATHLKECGGKVGVAAKEVSIYLLLQI